MSKQNGNGGEGHYDERHHVGDRPVPGPDQLLIHPDRQRGLLAGGEGGDDHFVKAEGERQHAPRQQGGGEVGQDHVAQGLEAVGPGSIDASIRLWLVRRKRARALL